MEKARHFFNTKFFKHWFLHALAIWLILTILGTSNYIYNATMGGGWYMHYENGEPVTGIQYPFVSNFRGAQIIFFFILAFFLESNYKWVIQKIDKGVLYIQGIILLCFTCIVIFHKLIVSKTYYDPEELIASIILYIIYFSIYAFIRYKIENKNKIAQNRYQKSQAELDVLKAQLNPHFFFNSLNNLYGTALQENAPKTVGLIEQLSSIMRYTMGEAQNPFTDIKNELDFIENYWALQEVRLPKKDNIQLSKHLFFDAQTTEIAPLLLIPFIENAFKYGSSIDKDCQIDLNLSIKNQQLQMVLTNTLQEGKTLDKGNGIGIENAKKRLDLIYCNRYTLTHRQEGNMYKVVLNIKLM